MKNDREAPSGANANADTNKATIRPATLEDIPAIRALVAVFAGQDRMLPLSFGDALERLRDFSLLFDAETGRLLGTVAVHVAWDDLAELRTLAVAEDAQGNGWGRRLVEVAKDEARRLRAKTLFTLSYIPDFFRKMGFREVDRQTLPRKIWTDCLKCPKFPDCDETALAYSLGD